jgi:hypothetical protein
MKYALKYGVLLIQIHMTSADYACTYASKVRQVDVCGSTSMQTKAI